MKGVQRGEHEELVEGRKGRSERLTLGSDVNQRCPACLDRDRERKEKKKATIKKEEESVWISTADSVGCRWLPRIPMLLC